MSGQGGTDQGIRFSIVKFLMGAAIGIAVLMACDRWFSRELTFVWAYRCLLFLVALPFAIMFSAIAIMFGIGLLITAPVVTAIVIVLLSSWLQVPWPIVAGVVVTGIVGLTAYDTYRPNRNRVTFRIYEFGADNIIPYYRWLFAPQRAPVTGIITGVGVWVLAAWAMSR